MRFARTMLAVAVVLLACVSHATAASVSGEELKRLCDSKDPANQGYCSGFIVGVSEVSYNVSHFCPQASRGNSEELAPSYSDYIAAVRKFIKDHPEHLREPAAKLAEVALATAYPCKQPKP